MADALAHISSENRSTMGHRLSDAHLPADGSMADQKPTHFVLGTEGTMFTQPFQTINCTSEMLQPTTYHNHDIITPLVSIPVAVDVPCCEFVRDDVPDRLAAETETEAAFPVSERAPPYAVGCPQDGILFNQCYLSTLSLAQYSIYCPFELDRRTRNMRNQIENHYAHAAAAVFSPSYAEE